MCKRTIAHCNIGKKHKQKERCIATEKRLKQPVVRPQLTRNTIVIVIYSLNRTLAEMKAKKQNKTYPTEYKQIRRLRKRMLKNQRKLKEAIEQNKKRRIDKPKPKPQQPIRIRSEFDDVLTLRGLC